MTTSEIPADDAIAHDQHPVAAWIIDTFAPDGAGSLLVGDRYALVEDGHARCYVRFFASLQGIGDALAAGLGESTDGVAGRVRVFDLTAPVDRCELTVSASVSLHVDEPEPATPGDPPAARSARQERADAIGRLRALVGCDPGDLLDDLVHDGAASMASEINNSGPDAQVEILMDMLGERRAAEAIKGARR